MGRPAKECLLGGSCAPGCEAWDDVSTDQLDTTHGIGMRHSTGLHDEDHLVDPGIRPLFDLSADRVRIAADRHAVLDQLIVGAGAEFCHDSVLAAGGSEAHAVEAHVVVAVVPARCCTREVATDTVVLVTASEREGADVFVSELADPFAAVAAADD